MKFLWTTLNVSNMDKSLEFYRNVAGLKLERRYSPVDFMDIAFLGEGETKIELICNKEEKSLDHGKSVSIGFGTASVDLKIEELKSQGIEIYEGPFQPAPHIRFFYILDPDGVKVQFVEEKAE